MQNNIRRYHSCGKQFDVFLARLKHPCRRIQNLIDNFAYLFPLHNVSAEIILVEWDPPSGSRIVDGQPLSFVLCTALCLIDSECGRSPFVHFVVCLNAVIKWPRDLPLVRIITVGNDYASSLPNPKGFKVNEYVGKNIGARRAK